MTGERVASLSDGVAVGREPSLPQPGGRAPAPGGLALVQGFINSHYDLEVDHGADLLATPVGLERWLARRGLFGAGELTARDVERAIAVREGLRALARRNNDPNRAPEPATLGGLNAAAHGAAVEVRFTGGGPRFVAVAGGGLDRALGVLLAVAAEAMLAGGWSRLKVCPGRHCGWAFYDHSRNQSSRWCSMAVCGGRAKARAHYHRRGRRDSGADRRGG